MNNGRNICKLILYIFPGSMNQVRHFCYNKWNKRQKALDAEYKRIRSIRYFAQRESNIYNMTEKEINTKLDNDEILTSYRNLLEAVGLIIEFIKKIQSLLDNQRYDIKEKFAYLRWVRGEDF